MIHTRMNSIRTFIGVSVLAVFALGSCTSEDGTETVDQAENGACPDSMAWLGQDPIPDPNFESFPCGYTVNSDGSVTNRAFHEISWQYFLWLTESVTVKNEKMLRFESMYNDESINLAANDPKAKTHILGGIQQAGSNSVLVDENGRAVYTTMMINEIYRDFVVNNKLNTPEGLRNFPDSTDFENGSMSIKASWKIIPPGKSAPKGSYTRKATVYDVVEINGVITTSDNYTDPAKQTTREETVALVGLHIAFVVKDHPEFIWATFEHNDNAPSYVYKNETKGTGVPTDSDYTFYKKGTAVSACNVSNLGAITVDPTTQVISGFYGVNSTTQVYRRYEYGGGSATNQQNIEDLNNEVHNGISKNSMWQNYSEVGAVWFDLDNGSLVPNWSLTVNPKLQTGSKTLSNSTIETFTQDPNQQNSCFSCHNTMKYTPPTGLGLNGKNVLTSHILLANYIHALSKKNAVVRIDRKE